MSDNVTLWQMPDWMKPFESHFRDLGAHKIETLMNCYGSKCAGLLVKAGTNPRTEDATDLAALICNAQVGLLVALKSADLLKDVPLCPLEKKP
jgi:hypothetical protein